jgi:hypothetical protein
MASKERYDALRAMDLDHAAATYGAEHADNVDEALDLAFAFANGEIGQEEARVSGGEPHIDAAQPHHSEDDATMAMLMDMGFPADRATEAAQLHKTDFEAALAYCTDYVFPKANAVAVDLPLYIGNVQRAALLLHKRLTTRGDQSSWDFGLYARALYVASTSKKLIRW